MTENFSFHKKGALKRNLPKGSRPSIHNSQLLISSGIPSFDSIIGGGVPVGSLIIINEDEYGTYAKLMLKYFLAEGIVSEHAVYIASQDVNAEEMIKELPAPVDSDLEDQNETKGADKKMTIAWRYENLKTGSLSDGNNKGLGHHFDLSKHMDNQVIQKSDVTIFSKKIDTCSKNFEGSLYYSLLKSIEKKLDAGLYFVHNTNPGRNILRIALFHMDSPFWQVENDKISQMHLLKFLYSLRALIRNAFATCCLTLPFSRLKTNLMFKCIHLSDIAIELQSFTGTKCENVAPYKDYHGFFIIQKLAALNSVTSYNPPSSNLAFKLRRKKLIIEAFSLPPELEETTKREEEESLSCLSINPNKLDF